MQQDKEFLINTNLPAGISVGAHGDVILEPEFGMFYETFSSGMRFYRESDLNLTDSETLLNMYHICTTISNHLLLSSKMLEEIKKRKHEDIIKRFYAGELEIKPQPSQQM